LGPIDRATSLLPGSWLIYFEAAVTHLGLGDTEATLRKSQMASFDLDRITLMNRGDIIFLYTDGVYDGEDEEERQKLEQIFRDYK
jgi:hypothetical protein